jgi:hypothetical protein
MTQNDKRLISKRQYEYICKGYCVAFEDLETHTVKDYAERYLDIKAENDVLRKALELACDKIAGFTVYNEKYGSIMKLAKVNVDDFIKQARQANKTGA